MSTADNFHKKVLSTNALKTNFIANTTKTKDIEKRFSNISKEKQHEFRNTIHKNPTRYHDEVDMQGSATILPHKTSSRKNIYVNQNSNTNQNPNTNQNYNPQIHPTHQRKQSSLQLNNMNPTKAKSPIEKTRINTIGYNTQTFVNHTQIIIPPSVGHHPLTMCQPNIANQIKPIPQIKNINPKINDALSDRQKSQRSYFQREQNMKEAQFKKKSMIIDNNRKYSSEFQELMCNQELQISLVPEKQHSKKVTNACLNRTEIKTMIKERQDTSLMNDHFAETNARTEKKCIVDKPTIVLEKTKSQHTIGLKQISAMGSATLVTNPVGHKSIPQIVTKEQNQIRTNKHYPPPLINYEEELRKFTQIEGELNMTAEIETIIGLENRQKKYVVQPNYIEIKQRNFNWFMRAILVDWMMHVCYEFGLKRETYHLAVALADKFLEKTTDLPKADFQLAGAATMFIAAKLQEFEPLSSAEFSKSTDNRYSPAEIRQMELKICKTMNYELNPPTLYMWANRFMVHWDSYIELTEAKYHSYFRSHKPKYFKKEDQESYLLFREMMQFIDCSILDVQTLQFAPKILVCSFMYLVLGTFLFDLGKTYKEWPVKRIIEEFPRSSHYLVQDEGYSQFNELFHMFLADSFELDIIELLPAVQYCSTYFNLPLSFEPPSYALKNGEQPQASLNLEEYESFQTYNGKMIDLIKKRYRGVYP